MRTYISILSILIIMTIVYSCSNAQIKNGNTLLSPIEFSVLSIFSRLTLQTDLRTGKDGFIELFGGF